MLSSTGFSISRISWVLVSGDAGVFGREQLREVAAEIAVRPGFRIWRDDYSSIFAVLK